MEHPIDQFLRAYKLYVKKEDRLAAESLAKSIGGDKATNPILNSLDKIFEEKTLIHETVLDAVVSESRRRRNVRL